MPKISVIIPVYKVERYLDACVASVAGQTYADLEIILVDDGSPDNCPALCDAWAKKDARIKVIHRPNGGLSAARNSGLDIAVGEFIAFVDSDDRLEPDVLQKAWETKQKTNAELVIFNLVCTDTENCELLEPDYTVFPDEVIAPAEFWSRLFGLDGIGNYYVSAWNKLYPASMFSELRYAVGKRYEDMFILPGIIDQCKTIACMSYQGYRYTQRPGSIMNQGNPRNYLDHSEFLLEWTKYFTHKGDALRAEGLLNDAIANLAEKDRFDLSTPAQQQRYRTACRACADAYCNLAHRTGKRSMLLRAALLRLGLPAYRVFLQHKSA
ncbi:MAG: glycosyltransferase family 2 protein [Gemmiger sp.]|uniref:glycosyltransferase family 2 protein n=1 Tax=Gemmiger sp. TaxID=2049027 RepID=UPI002A915D35|nr:glycosyltransferase family 2 protein [Gemmiger sp.]MDY5410807.1 glycosyltransferase family 2 protein [Gemmiger sp.]